MVNSELGADTSTANKRTIATVVLLTTVAQIGSAIGIAVFPVITPRLAAEMGVAPSLIGYQMSLLYGSAMIASPLLSFMVPRWGACRTSQVGLGFCVIAMALGLTSSFWGLAGTSILLGMSMSIMTPASAHLLIRFSPAENRNFIFSLKQTGVPLAWMLMALIAPAMTAAFGWRSALLLVLAVALAILLALEWVRPRWDDDRHLRTAVRQRPFDGLTVLWRYPALRWLAAASVSLTFVQLCLATFTVTMLVEEAGYSLIGAGLMLSLVHGSGVAGRVAWGWVADRSGDSAGVLAKLCLVMTGCCVLMAFTSPAWPAPLMGLLFIIFGATAAGWNGVFMAEVARRSPRGLASVTTSGAIVWNFGGILVGPALFATAYKFVGSYAVTYGMLALVAAAGVALLLMCAAATRRERAAPKQPVTGRLPRE